ncbi:DUF262 domain-containing protein [Luteirhabdus pelagi]|uniref:DUF262 domain-containing protein n=1 Tax=Luteirhabdus pelagi TaxID=2792783 RepID=UPI00193A7861|nr:DUF262 domain-containing protein [Luteirhabdus pelagi]
MAKLIEVEERDLNYIFGKPKPYSLDVYQRDYRWADDKDYKVVTQLLKDIELRFENNMAKNKRNQSVELPKILNDVESNFKPYFLNTIMLNEQSGNIYIVDGQQRLTTLLLILIKLYHIGNNKEGIILNVKKFIGDLIYEEDMASIKHFKISNQDRNKIIAKIFEKEEIEKSDIANITQQNLDNNYEVISKYYDDYFNSDGSFEIEKYNYYVYNLLQKVLIIEQVIKHKEDVAMIFETANDRGKELDPHEVLKGMLLGVLDIKVKEECNAIWNTALQTFFEIDGTYKNVDDFFRTYFRAKYADNATQYNRFANKYHRNLLSNDRIIQDLDRSNPEQIYSFIQNDFIYYYKLYLKVKGWATENKNIFLASNYANEQGQQYLLLLSALSLNDAEEDTKIEMVAKKFDQFYTISRLINAGDNNDRQKLYYDLSVAIRNKPLNKISECFDGITVPFLREKGFPIKNFNEIFQYKYFSRASRDGRFTKYVFGRIDWFLANLLSEQSFAKEYSLHFITHSGNKPKNGFHLEHIFSWNDDIMDQFVDDDGAYDEKLFIDERDRLGALLLMKGNENIRTSNWKYRRKKKSYANSGFIWNRILTDSINKASLNSCKSLIKENFKSYKPDENGLLEVSAIDERQELLFELIKEIYSN